MTGTVIPRIVVGITGASGTIFGVRCLERLREAHVETHLIVSPWGARTLEHETGLKPQDVARLADVHHRTGDLSASISSGSFITMGMIVAPCSMKTLAQIATGIGQDLIPRAADVVLKERRRLVLLARESPLHETHLENMLRVTRMGAVVLPPVPAFYNRPASIDDIVDHVVTRSLDQFGIHSDASPRWNGEIAGR